MPVKFKGASEYTDNYPEFQSYKSQSFEPSPEQAARSAGLQTTKTAVVFDPPLQRKKRLDGPPVSLSADYYNGELNGNVGEYALLGNQDKFASNVKYRPKSAYVSNNNNNTNNNNNHDNTNNNRAAVPPVKQLRLEHKQDDIKPQPVRSAPVVDTHKFTEPPNPPTPLAPRQKASPQKTKMIQTQTRTESKPATKVVKQAPAVVHAPSVLKHRQEMDPPVKQGLKDKNLSDVLGQMKKKKASMNEFAQTNMEKGVADSAPEAPAEYSMKYKAGVAPPRVSRKQSEYQREFEWKNRMKASPMLAAEQIVYKSSVGPVKAASFPKTSEYKSQFKKWKPIENEPVPALKRAMQQNAAIKNKALKRSKSVGAVDRWAGEKHGDDGEEDVKPDKHHKSLPHHGKLRKVVTEYGANFKPPQKFNYEKGAWKGANPPHVFAQKTEAAPAAAAVEVSEEPTLSSWFAEVLELRQKASEYKKRAQGTHFSREHLVQLLAKQAGMWDLASARSDSTSTLSALSLEAGGGKAYKQQRSRNERRAAKNLVDFDSCHATIADSEVPYDGEGEMYEAEEEVMVEDKPAQRKRNRNINRKMAWLEEHQKQSMGEEEPVQQRFEDDHQERVSSVDDNDLEGRLPTPLMRQSIKFQKKPRHHLDRTTPSVGGALLTSPEPVRSRSHTSGSTQETIEEEPARKDLGKTYQIKRLLTTPTFGGPSADTHVLRDDDASVDRPLKPTYIYAPNDQIEELEQENLATIQVTPPVIVEPVVEAPRRRQSRKKERQRPAGIPSTLYEQMGDTYNKPVFQPPQDDDDDNVSLSMSVRSITSSCSLASDVYERAKDRRDFWNKGGIATR